MHKKEGELLKEALKKAGKSQQWLADELNVHRNTIGNYIDMQELPKDFMQQLGKLGIEIVHPQMAKEDMESYFSIGSTILHVPIEAEAGFLGGAVTPAMNYDLKEWSLPGFDEPGYSFLVKGMSMFPTLKEGEFIVTGRNILSTDGSIPGM